MNNRIVCKINCLDYGAKIVGQTLRQTRTRMKERISLTKYASSDFDELRSIENKTVNALRGLSEQHLVCYENTQIWPYTYSIMRQYGQHLCIH